MGQDSMRQSEALCKSCGVHLTNMNWKRHNQEHHHYLCDRCYKEWRSTARKANRSRENEYYMRWWLGLKVSVMSHYSEHGIPKCNMCGNRDTRVLTIDHKNGGGKKLRQKIVSRIMLFLKTNNYPEGYQVLCMNCQWIKRYENHES